jgi:hypothetical protein
VLREVLGPSGVRPHVQREARELYERGEYAAALEATEANLRAFREIGSELQVADSLTLTSAIAWRLGDGRASWERLEEALRTFGARDLASGLVRALGMAALVHLEFGDPELGARLAGATNELRRQKNVMVAPTRVLHLPDATELSRERLGAERADALVAEGAAMSTARAVEDALAGEASIRATR